MRYLFAGMVLFCAGNSFWALSLERGGWCAFWGALAVVNSICYHVQLSREKKIASARG